ncbi:unnamed protein product [Paramecium sonneborni]|uniref:Uncharacterized protein n=1 Tax=Paramecium sonneborni TaxID=65129 RepID=A0A8S1LAU1_9CILI|nr:unnamed protein product [Paramecium sonneborni]
MNPFNHQNQNSNFMTNYAYNASPFLQSYFDQLSMFYLLQRQLKSQANQGIQNYQQKIETIIISSDEEQPIIKQKEQLSKVIPAALQKKGQKRILDLDQLELQGGIYQNDSFESPLQQERVQKCLKSQQSKILNRNESLQPFKLKKKILKSKKQPKKYCLKGQKQILIGKQRQQYLFNQSSVKTQLIKVYTKNEEKLLKIRELLHQNFPNSNDEDAIRLLNATGKSYEKAMDLIKENELLVQYMLETNKINEILEDDDLETIK